MHFLKFHNALHTFKAVILGVPHAERIQSNIFATIAEPHIFKFADLELIIVISVGNLYF